MSEWATFCPDRPSILRKILWNRGLRDTAEAERFLQPRLTDIPLPHDNLLDLDEALRILLKARDEKLPITIFGDYDVDGSTSTALLVSVLRDFNFNVSYYIPHRIHEGYGLTKKAAEAMLRKLPATKLVITCDNGIGSFDGISLLKSKQVQVIVTDHHEVPSERVPADAVINPKQKRCPYPDKKLAGVGVAFLLLMGLRRALQASDYGLSRFLDLVAVGTVCDVAELLNANRIFARIGMAKLFDSSLPGLRLLARHCPSYPKSIRARDLGFFIGPRLNASGRVGEPDLGVRTLLASSETEAMELIQILERENQRRRQLQDEQVAEAELRAESLLKKAPQSQGLILSDEGFHLGIVGLVASRISEKFSRPSCVLTKVVDEHELAMNPFAKGLWKGSLRAPVGYHLAQALEWIKKEAPEILVSGGGHAQAAGVGIEEKNLETFSRLFELALGQQLVTTVEPHVDADLSESKGLEEVLRLMEPFGAGNPSPLFRVKGMKVERVSAMKEVHLKFWGQAAGRQWAVLQFKSPWVNMFSRWVHEGLEADLLVELQENEWNGRCDLELLLKDLVAVKVNGEETNVIKGRSQRTNEVLATKGV